MLVDRCALFIDGAYLDHVIDTEFNRVRVDFHLFAHRLAGADKILRTYYYDCPPYVSATPNDDEIRRAEGKDRFFNALAMLPRFQLRLGHVALRGHDDRGRPICVQKLVDIMLGVDLVQLSATRQITRAIVVTGDVDFVPAIEVAKQQGVLVTLFHGPLNKSDPRDNTVNRVLWTSCDERFEISQELIAAVRLNEPARP
jgi:uncharacterized LabA/DUF88 family protein